MGKGVLWELAREGRYRRFFDRRLIYALSHPFREHLMAVFSEGPASATEIAEELGIDATYIYSHIDILSGLDFIEEVEPPPRKKKRGKPARYYLAKETCFLDNDASAALPKTIESEIAATHLRAVVDEAEAAFQAGTFSAFHNRHSSWVPMILDRAGWDEVMTILDRALDRAMLAHRGSLVRLIASGEAGIPVTVGMFGFGRPEGYSYGLGSVTE